MNTASVHCQQPKISVVLLLLLARACLADPTPRYLDPTLSIMDAPVQRRVGGLEFFVRLLPEGTTKDVSYAGRRVEVEL